MTNHVYKHIELTGSSKTGTDEAIRNTPAKASETNPNNPRGTPVGKRGQRADGKGG